MCKFHSEKLSVRVVQCYSETSRFSDYANADEQRTVGWSLAFLAGVIVISYNIALMSHLYGESVSLHLHEGYVVKKEVEFCLGVSTTWLTRYFFFFSSYRGGLYKMFGRPVFNFMCVGMVAVHAVIP